MANYAHISHTPGPWRVKGHTKEGFEVWGNGGPTFSFRVAVTGHANTFDQANAHLIAVAPDLYDFAKAIEKVVMNSGHNLCSTATEAEKTEFISGIINAWNNGGFSAICKAEAIR